MPFVINLKRNKIYLQKKIVRDDPPWPMINIDISKSFWFAKSTLQIKYTVIV